MRHRYRTIMDKQAALRNYYKRLQKDNEVTQITVTNHTDDIRRVCLWGANNCEPLTDPLFIGSEGNVTVNVGSHPQGLVYNSANDLFYAVNQLDDSVSVINISGEIVDTINFGVGGNPSFIQNALPGSISPSAITVNTNENSDEYGIIAVACSVSNEVVFINPENNIARRIGVDNRPTDIVYNPVDNCYYTTNLVAGTISKLCEVRRQNNLPRIEQVRNIGVNPNNGDLYVYDLNEGLLNAYDVSGNYKGSLGSVQEESVSFDYHPPSGKVYVLLETTGNVLIVNPKSFKTEQKLRLSEASDAIAFNPHNQLIYIGNSKNRTITRINAKHQIVDTIKAQGFSSGIAFSSKENILAVSDASNDTVTIEGNTLSPTVTVNDEYFEYREDFQHNPTLISHLKIVASGDDRINALQRIERSITGKETCRTLSLSNYQSPQNFSNISEVFDMDGDIVDGHTIWCFKINPKQVVTFLMYHKQFEMYNVLPEKSRISTGVQMSKGIPASWLEYNENEPPDEQTD